MNIGSNKNGCLCILMMNIVQSNNSTAVLLHSTCISIVTAANDIHCTV